MLTRASLERGNEATLPCSPGRPQRGGTRPHCRAHQGAPREGGRGHTAVLTRASLERGDEATLPCSPREGVLKEGSTRALVLRAPCSCAGGPRWPTASPPSSWSAARWRCERCCGEGTAGLAAWASARRREREGQERELRGEGQPARHGGGAQHQQRGGTLALSTCGACVTCRAGGVTVACSSTKEGAARGQL